MAVLGISIYKPLMRVLATSAPFHRDEKTVADSVVDPNYRSDVPTLENWRAALGQLIKSEEEKVSLPCKLAVCILRNDLAFRYSHQHMECQIEELCSQIKFPYCKGFSCLSR